MVDVDEAAFEHDIELPVRPDPEDLKDRPYRAPDPENTRPWAEALRAVLAEPMDDPPPRVTYDLYKALVSETWQQRGEECTGFALAAIANFHLRMHKVYSVLASEIFTAFRKDVEIDFYAYWGGDEEEAEQAKRRIAEALEQRNGPTTDLKLRSLLDGRRKELREFVDDLFRQYEMWMSEDFTDEVDELRGMARDRLDKWIENTQWWELRATAADLYPLLRKYTAADGQLDVCGEIRRQEDWRFLDTAADCAGARWLSPGLASLLHSRMKKVARRYKSLRELDFGATELGRDSALTVSRRMLYEMAQKYDRQAYEEGSTLRGALRGWNALGVAAERAWVYAAGDEHGVVEGELGLARMLDAVRRPGAYYFRIDTSDDAAMLRTMRQALARGGGSYPLYCSARLHSGWYRLFLGDEPGKDRVIRQIHGDEPEGYHAFVIVGYDDHFGPAGEAGFWIHNSWGQQWGNDGYAFLPVDDWVRNKGDAWALVPRPPPGLLSKEDLAKRVIDRFVAIPEPDRVPTSEDMWPHLVPIGDDGRLVTDSPYGIDESLVKTLLYLFQEETRQDFVPRLLLFADGGYLPREYAVGLLKRLRSQLLGRRRIYPIFLVWETAWWALTRVWIDQLTWQQTGEPDPWQFDPSSAAVNEVVADSFAPSVWKEAKRRARRASEAADGATRLLANAISYKWGQQVERGKPFQVHLVAHGSGDLLLSHLAPLLPAPITTCTLWAPATTMEEFRASYVPMLDDGRLEHMMILALDETKVAATGFEDALHIVSSILHFDWPWHARERAFGAGASPHRPEPLLGMQRYLLTDPEVARLRGEGKVDVQVLKYPLHELVISDVVDARAPSHGSRWASGGDEMLRRTIDHITSFTEPPVPVRRRDSMAGEPRPRDPLLRARAGVPLGRGSPPSGRRG